jgi:hypothetical protein
MSEFTASNGIRVVERTVGLLGVELKDQSGTNTLRDFDHLAGAEVDAMREYFQHETDAALKRSRWSENASVLVYVYSRDTVAVLDERSADVFRYTREEINRLRELGGPVADYARAAAEYFDAHPEPKPWHDAKPGDIWLLRFQGFETAEATPWGVRSDGALFEVEFVYPPNGNTMALIDPEIVGAQRIWPEATS